LAGLDIDYVFLVQPPGFIHNRHIGSIVIFLKQAEFVAMQYDSNTTMLVGIK
jgi:hypothetical protein